MLVTVGIPVYNGEDYISNAIESILEQSYPNFELIIIDDGSTDKSLEIAKSYKDPRVKVFSDGKNKRLPARLNQIIDLASGAFIMRMDADDFCSENRIEKLLEEFYRNPDLDVVFSRICSITNSGSINGIHGKIRTYPIKLRDTIKGNTGLPHASLMARKEWYLRNKYNEKNRLCEDYELYLTALIKEDFKVSVIPDVLYFYREESNVSYNRMSVAYKGQIEILKSLIRVNSSLKPSLIRCEIHKFRIKLLIIKIVAFVGLEKILFNRRGNQLTQVQDAYFQLEIKRLIK